MFERVLLGAHDFRVQPGAPRSQVVGGARAALLESLFPVAGDASIVVPERRVQVVGADLDRDGDEDVTLIQFLPFTGAAGKTIAANSSEDFELKPLRKFQIQSISGDEDLFKKLVVTSFFIAQEDLFVAKGAIPLVTFAHNATLKQFASQLAGPGVPITITIANITNADVKLYATGIGVSIVG